MLVSDHRTHLGTLSLHVMLKESLDDILVVNMHKQLGWGHFVGLWQCCLCNGPVDMANLCLTDGAEQPVEAAGAVSCYQVAKSKTREKSIKKPSLSGGCLVVAFPVQLLSPFYWIHNSLCFLSGHPDISEVNRLCVKLKIECSPLFFHLSSAVFAVILSGLKLQTEWLISLLQCLQHR